MRRLSAMLWLDLIRASEFVGRGLSFYAVLPWLLVFIKSFMGTVCIPRLLLGSLPGTLGLHESEDR